jgi:hypothetical protein
MYQLNDTSQRVSQRNLLHRHVHIRVPQDSHLLWTAVALTTLSFPFMVWHPHQHNTNTSTFYSRILFIVSLDARLTLHSKSPGCDRLSSVIPGNLLLLFEGFELTVPSFPPVNRVKHIHLSFSVFSCHYWRQCNRYKFTCRLDIPYPCSAVEETLLCCIYIVSPVLGAVRAVSILSVGINLAARR